MALKENELCILKKSVLGITVVSVSRDEDGVLSFQELQLVMKSMGQRPPGQNFSQFPSHSVNC